MAVVFQVKSHAKTHKEDRNQFKLRIDWQTVSLQKSLEVCSEDKVIQAEILQALHFAERNYSFASAASDGDRFWAMFPDSNCKKLQPRKNKDVIQH